MPTLDQMLDGLTVEIQPFAICEARGVSVIDLGARSDATLHYVLAGSGTFTMAGLPDTPSRTGTILITPRRLAHRVQPVPNGECETLACAPSTMIGGSTGSGMETTGSSSPVVKFPWDIEASIASSTILMRP